VLRVQAFQLGVPRIQVHDFDGQAEIGVAVKVTFVHTLQETGNISSNMDSLFLRDEFTDEPSDGSFALGSYDGTIKEDSVMTRPFTVDGTDCPKGITARVTDLRSNIQDGPVINVPDGFGVLYLCVVPSLRAVIAIPGAYREKLIESIGGTGSDKGIKLGHPTSSDGRKVFLQTPTFYPDRV
jgi:hypothetical protein